MMNVNANPDSCPSPSCYCMMNGVNQGYCIYSEALCKSYTFNLGYCQSNSRDLNSTNSPGTTDITSESGCISNGMCFCNSISNRIGACVPTEAACIQYANAGEIPVSDLSCSTGCKSNTCMCYFKNYLGKNKHACYSPTFCKMISGSCMANSG